MKMRERCEEVLRAEPGADLSEVARRVGCSRSTALVAKKALENPRYLQSVRAYGRAYARANAAGHSKPWLVGKRAQTLVQAAVDHCWIQTVRGGRFNLLDPRPEQVDILDIAHHLSNICRYVGAVPTFYSVAQHSVLVSELCEREAGREAGRWGLVHDAAEAYLGDLSWPAKQIPGLREAYAAVEEPILRGHSGGVRSATGDARGRQAG